MKKNWFLALALIAMVLASFLWAVPAHASNLLKSIPNPTFYPETITQASEAFNVPLGRLYRDPIGGIGWMIREGDALNGVIIPKYFRLDWSGGDSVVGPATQDGVLIGTIWMVGLPYPAPNFDLEFVPAQPVEGQNVDFNVVGDNTPSEISTLLWDMGNGTYLETFTSDPGFSHVSYTYAAAGTYSVLVTMMDSDGDVVYTVDAVQISITDKPQVYMAFMPLVSHKSAAPTWVQLLTKPMNFCPDRPEDFFGGNSTDYTKIGECGFKNTDPTKEMYLTLQLGTVWQFDDGVARTAPSQIVYKGTFSVWVSTWW